MRVLYVINGFDPGGAEHGLLTLIENDAFANHDLRVLALCRGRGNLAERATNRLGSRVQFVSDHETLSAWACVRGFARIAADARRFRPHKLVLSLKQANVVGRLAAAFAPSLTCVAFEHIAQYRARHLQWAYGPLLGLLSWRVDEIWTDCRETLEQTRRYYLPRRRAGHVIPLFVARPDAPSKTNYNESSPVRLAAAGRLVARKNVPLAIETLVRLHGQGLDATLDVYGDGPERPQIEALVAQRKLQDRVQLHGYKRDWIAQAAAADVFVNLSDTEGFCIVLAEALLAGLPAVAVDVGGVRDYGRDGENLLKLGSPDAGAACAAVSRLVTDAALRERLGRQARLDMLRDYEPSSCRKRVDAALRDGLPHRGPKDPYADS